MFCVLTVLAVRREIYALPDERELAKRRDVLKFTMAVEGKDPIADDTVDRPRARVEKFQPAWELSVEL